MDAASMDFKFSIRRLFFITLAAALVVGIPTVLISIIGGKLSDSYKLQWTAGMIIEHVESNEGEWPKGWEELRIAFNKHNRIVKCPWTFEQIRKRIQVDWSVSVDVIESNSRIGVWPVNTDKYQYYNHPANQRIREFIRRGNSKETLGNSKKGTGNSKETF